MHRSEDVAFLKWCLPRLRMRYRGFRKVRGQVLKRVKHRMKELGVGSLGDYRACLELRSGEWDLLDRMCRITISRFCRDRGVFDFLFTDVAPNLAEDARRHGRTSVRCWCAGCASGEEPYTLAVARESKHRDLLAGLDFEIIATDADGHLLQRAKKGCYTGGSISELPAGWREQAFEPVGDGFCLRDRFRRNVVLLEQDIRKRVPEGPFDLVLCRNLAFTYFDSPLQVEIAGKIRSVLRPGGALLLGKHEQLPDECPGFGFWHQHLRVYRRLA